MRITFKKIPRLAKWFYGIGFCLITFAMSLFFFLPDLLPPVRLQQVFIGGAIVVVIGSVINTINQFKSNNSNHQE